LEGNTRPYLKKSLTAKLSIYDILRKVKKRMEELSVFSSAQSERYKGFNGKYF